MFEAPFDYFPLIAIVAACLTVLTYSLVAFYLIHAFSNPSAHLWLRVVLGLGFFVLPYVAMPAYFLLYILPPSPPSWALSPLGAPGGDIPRDRGYRTAVLVIAGIIFLIVILAPVIIVLAALLGPAIGTIFSMTGRMSIAA